MLAPPYRRHAQSHRQINPFRIFRIDQIYLPLAMPVFQLLLPRNGGFHRAERLEMNQPVNSIFGGIAGSQTAAMLRQPLEQVRSYTNVQRAVMATCEDIYARLLFQSHRRGIAAKWTLKQVQGDEFGVVLK
jgi:hypothetical protein